MNTKPSDLTNTVLTALKVRLEQLSPTDSQVELLRELISRIEKEKLNVRFVSRDE
jgi:hypothetical protein